MPKNEEKTTREQLWHKLSTDADFKARTLDALYHNASDGDRPDEDVLLANARLVYEQLSDEKLLALIKE